ncbi:MAG: hypothetical protein ACOYOO_08250, partial [Saprospiraceae bacterium]
RVSQKNILPPKAAKDFLHDPRAHAIPNKFLAAKPRPSLINRYKKSNPNITPNSGNSCTSGRKSGRKPHPGPAKSDLKRYIDEHLPVW